MTYIKRITMNGFKSFASKTDVIFDKGINTVVGPNGAGKSNISDALCFALGRLSIKSMRAAKAKNLLFMGSKGSKPAKEASVEIVLNNDNKTFNLPHNEILLKRIVRRNGQSIYKINGETKTRSEIIETLAQAGIDPYGFNIILQGQIQTLIKVHPEERRKIIEEVAGISIYETRKEKSLRELEKTDDRLKEISTVLRERTAFLRNLERERAQALKFKELETAVKRCKASLITKKTEEKQKELNAIRKSIEQKLSQKDKAKQLSEEMQNQISSFNERINQINKHIQQSTGIEQETLTDTITNLKAELEGLRVRKENYENRRLEMENRIQQMESSIPEYESEIQELRKESPKLAKKQEELSRKKEELSGIEEQRKEVYRLKTELGSLRERAKDKAAQLTRCSTESDSLVKEIEEYTTSFTFLDKLSCQKEISKLKENLRETTDKITSLNTSELDLTKVISSAETQIISAEKIKSQIQDLETCPLCQNKMTKEHTSHVNSDSESKIKEAKKTIASAQKELNDLIKNRRNLQSTISTANSSIAKLENELSFHVLIADKQTQLKKFVEQEKELKGELQLLEQRRDIFEKKTYDISGVEEKYNSKMLEIEEISSRTEKDLDTALLYKERELEKFSEAIKQSNKNIEEIDSELDEILVTIDRKSESLEKKEQEEEVLNEKFQKLFKERESLQSQIQTESYNLSTSQSGLQQMDEQINFLKVGNAKLDAEREALEMELNDFKGVELIKATTQAIEERLQRSQQSLQTIGSINMRALEIYDEIKEEYSKVKEKSETLATEKQEILKIIEEIDKKKKISFMKTFRGINELFIRNFSELSTKGQASLEVENRDDIFSGGVNIAIKMQKGKSFDVASLSGGEQTLIALSLLFAIQEYKPHHFYIFDEIDAALDKRNSERLSALLKKHIQAGQYIIVTHNDAIITDSNYLYGVTMHEGISKVLSLKLD